MRREPSSRGEVKAWLAVVLWCGLIFVSIPVARALRDVVNARFGDASFGYATLAAIVLAVIAVSIALVRRAATLPWQALAWIAAVGAAYVLAALQLWAQPEEAAHLVEYGLLSLLAANAFRHRSTDRTLFLQAILFTAGVGTLDEIVQWVNPSRYFGFRDIAINAGAACLAQLALAKGVLRGPRPPTTRASVVRTSALGLLFLSLLGLTLGLTPARIEGLAERVPALASLNDFEDAMGEYGHRHEVAGVGVFKSRFTLEELEHIDRERGHEAAALVSPRRMGYKEFLQTTSRVSHPFEREARIHLSSRNRRLRDARRAADPARRAEHAAVALGENRLLERFWKHTTLAAEARLGPNQIERLERWADPEHQFVSKVDRHLITWLSERQALSLVGSGMLLCVVTGALARRRARSGRDG